MRLGGDHRVIHRRAERLSPPERAPSHAGRKRPSERRGPARHVLLLALICVVYLCTISDANVGWVGDGRMMLDTAVSLHEFGELAIGYYEDPDRGFVPRPGGFGKYGLGFSFVQQVPLIISDSVEAAVGPGSSNLLLALMSMLLTAMTALAIALSVEAMGCTFRAGALAAIGFAFGTFAWPYISYDFSEPLQSLCLVCGFWLVARSAKNRRFPRTGLALAASALGFAVLTKAGLLVLIPGFVLYLWLSLESPLPAKFRRFAWFGVPLALWGILIAALNIHRFGSFLEFGYGSESMQFTTPLLEGLHGLLLSPNKGLVIYAPLSLLACGAFWVRTSHRREVVLLLSTVAVQVLVTAKWWSWEGGASWGPRLLLPVVPLVVICAALKLDSSRWWSVLFTACVAAGVIINLLAVLLYFFLWTDVLGAEERRVPLDVSGRPAREYIEQDGRKWFPPAVATNYVPALSPIVGHAWLLRLRYFGVPFPLETLSEGSSPSTPEGSYPPVGINPTRLTAAVNLPRLRSANLWLWDLIRSRPRDPILFVSVYGKSFWRLGEAAATNGDRDRAEHCYRRAAVLMPDLSRVATELSELQSQRGARGEAMETLARYLSRHPRSPGPRLRLAKLYDSAGDLAGALREYRTYLGLGPDQQNRRDVERRIEQLTAAPP